MEIKQGDIVLCEFYFTDQNRSKKRPVMVLKDNLPFDDFIAIPISSKIEKLFEDEIIVDNSDFQNGAIPKKSKIIIRKTFVVSKKSIQKKYATLKNESFDNCFKCFCEYFSCNKNR